MLKPKFAIGEHVRLLDGKETRIKIVKAPTKQVRESGMTRNAINDNGLCSYCMEGSNGIYLLEREILKID
jgi:hypothetical protein